MMDSIPLMILRIGLVSLHDNKKMVSSAAIPVNSSEAMPIFGSIAYHIDLNS
ncbi:hypothetical protein D3C80_2225810 [compost metagenome]